MSFLRVPTIAPGMLAATLIACGGENEAAPTPATSIPSATAAASTPSPTSWPTPVAATANTAPVEREVLKELRDLAAAFRLAVMWGNGKFGVDYDGPNDITIDAQDRVYVTEIRAARFRQFSPDGELLMEVGSEGSRPSQFSQPIGIAVDAEGSIFVSEAGNSRVQRFTPDGEFDIEWGGVGTGPGQFLSAMEIAINDAGEVFVADLGNHRIQVFNRDGEFQ